MQRVRISLVLALGIIAVGIGLAAGGRGFLRALEAPTPIAIPPELALPEIPMPTVSSVEGVLSALPPVEAEKLIRPPTVVSSRILYLKYELSGSGRVRYHSLDPQTGEQIELGPFPPPQDGGELLMHASPTGKQILYSVYFDLFTLDPVVGVPEAREMGMGSIWTMNPDGSNKRQLAGSDGLYFPANAIWSPDGQQIAFLRLPDPRAIEQGKLKAEQAELWVMNADGSEQRKAADLPYSIDHVFGVNSSMRWLLDDHIYIVTKFVKGEWLRISPRTSKVTRLMENVDLGEINISPDTRWIAGISDAKITALGRQSLHLPSNPVWDPSGARAAFMNFPPPYGDKALEPGIWLMDLQIGKLHRLSSLDVTSTMCGRLSWSPDGKMLLCESIEGLYVIWIERDESRMVVPNPLAKENAVGIKFVGWIPVSTYWP